MRTASVFSVLLVFALAGCAASGVQNGASVNEPLRNPLAPATVSRDSGLSSNDFVAEYPAEWLQNPAGWTGSLALGHDKNMWADGFNTIGRVTPTGTITTYQAATTGYFIVRGPNNSLWFDTMSRAGIGRITSHGVVTYIPLFQGSGWALGAADGPDGNLWFVDSLGFIGFITPTGTITEYPAPGVAAGQITTGPDGNLWFTSGGQSIIGKITTSGAITTYPLPPQCQEGSGDDGIVSGPDGNIWAKGYCFTGPHTAFYALYKISPAGSVAVIPSPGEPPGNDTFGAIAVGPDKQIWLTDQTQHGLLEFEIAKQKFSKLASFPDSAGVSMGLAIGPDGDVWFTGNGALPLGNYVGVYEENVAEVGIRLNGEMSIIDPTYGFELGYAQGRGDTTQTIGLRAGESVRFVNLDTIPHSAAFLGTAAPSPSTWPATFAGSTTQSPAGTAIGSATWATGSLNPGATSPIYETGLPGFYMIGCQYHYVSNEMRTVIIVR